MFGLDGIADGILLLIALALLGVILVIALPLMLVFRLCRMPLSRAFAAGFGRPALAIAGSAVYGLFFIPEPTSETASVEIPLPWDWPTGE